MPILNIAIGKSKYAINCDDGEEDKIIALAEKLNKRVNKMSLVARAADEKTILMLCALTIEEELESANNSDGIFAKKDFENNFDNNEAKILNQNLDENKYQISQEELEHSVAMQIETTANYIQKLTKKIENL